MLGKVEKLNWLEEKRYEAARSLKYSEEWVTQMLTFCDVNQNISNMGPDRTILPQALRQTSSQHGVVNVKINSPPVEIYCSYLVMLFFKMTPSPFPTDHEGKIISSCQRTKFILYLWKFKVNFFICLFLYSRSSFQFGSLANSTCLIFLSVIWA